MIVMRRQGPEGFLSLCHAPNPPANSIPHIPALTPFPVPQNICFCCCSPGALVPSPHFQQSQLSWQAREGGRT